MTDVASNGNETCVLEDKSVIVDVDEDEAIDTLTFGDGWLDRDGVDFVVMSREILGTDGKFSVDVIRASGNETVLADKSMIVADDEAEAIDTLPSNADWIDHDGVDVMVMSRGILGTDGEFSTVEMIRASGNETVLADKSVIVDVDEAEA